MPFKHRSDLQASETRRRAVRALESNVERVKIEERIVDKVRSKPGYYDVLGLYAFMRRYDRIPIHAVAKGVDDLLTAGVLTWVTVVSPSGEHLTRLSLTTRAREVL